MKRGPLLLSPFSIVELRLFFKQPRTRIIHMSFLSRFCSFRFSIVANLAQFLTTRNNLSTANKSKHASSASLGNPQRRSFSSSSRNDAGTSRGHTSGTMPPIESTNTIESFVKGALESHKIVIFSKTTCPWCDKVKKLFKELNETYHAIELDELGKNSPIPKQIYVYLFY